MSLRERARSALAVGERSGTIEGLFWSAALETLASGSIVDPDLAVLFERLPAPDPFADLPPHSDHRIQRVRALEDVTLLAIASADDDALRRMEAIWTLDPDPSFEWRTGWIGLATSRTILDPEAIEFLLDDHMIAPEMPVDAAWLALHASQPDVARSALRRAEEAARVRQLEWERQPDLAIDGAWYFPGLILHLPERAIASVLHRWFEPA